MTNIGNITLTQGDCLQVLPTLPDNSVDLVLTDLPYGCLNKRNKHAQWDKEIDIDALWTELLRVVKPNAAIVLFGQGLFSAKLMMSQPKLYRYSLVWDKVRTTGFLNANKMPLRQHEDILVFYRELPAYNPQLREVAPHLRTHSRSGKSKPNANSCYGGMKQSAQDGKSCMKFPTSILQFQKKHKDWVHPTEKDVPLLEYLIRTYSNEGDCVLDCTMGSGSTMVACANTNRKGIGIELMEEYYNIAVKRVSDALAQPKLDLAI
ncbi:MAG: site-specific DNA-methyltransferase [Bacteroides sp.]|nr:site-specific DNA-methyltransferase [Bacteroides sp.]